MAIQYSNYDNIKLHPHPVMTIGACRIWGGSAMLVADPSDYDLIIEAADLSFVGGYIPPASVQPNTAARTILPMALFPPETPIVKLDWPDFGTPMISAEWWEVFAKALQNMSGKVLLCCQGGKGRTGTMLACLAPYSEEWAGYKNPIAFVRHHHDPDAVESRAQIEYVRAVTGLSFEAQPSSVLPPRQTASPPTPSAATLPGWSEIDPLDDDPELSESSPPHLPQTSSHLPLAGGWRRNRRKKGRNA